jgi:hypothetical protein
MILVGAAVAVFCWQNKRSDTVVSSGPGFNAHVPGYSIDHDALAMQDVLALTTFPVSVIVFAFKS